MDEPLVALGAAITLIVALAGAIWWVVASARRDRRRQQIAADYARRYQVDPGLLGHREPAHLFRGQGEAMTVAELLEDAEERCPCRRLDWPGEDLDEPHLVRPYAQDQVETTIFPTVADSRDTDGG